MGRGFTNDTQWSVVYPHKREVFPPREFGYIFLCDSSARHIRSCEHKISVRFDDNVVYISHTANQPETLGSIKSSIFLTHRVFSYQSVLYFSDVWINEGTLTDMSGNILFSSGYSRKVIESHCGIPCNLIQCKPTLVAGCSFMEVFSKRVLII